ncbi:exostosin domain-containing protein, partial [Brunnivagina elsteri]
MKLKIFSDKQYFSENAPLVPFLYPFLGTSSLDKTNSLWQSSITLPALENWTYTASSYFEMTSVEEANLIIFPNDLEFFGSEEVNHNLVKLLAIAKRLSKPVVVFFSGDCSHLPLPIDIDIDISFRDSLYRSSRKSNQFLMPTWIEDLIPAYCDNQFQVRQKQKKPVIGFCGYTAPKDIKTYLKILLYKLRQILPKREGTIPPYHTGHVIRTLVLSNLNKSSLVETNFMLRPQAGLVGTSSNEAKSYRHAFVQNILNSDYILCCRGSGNHSNRLYETLCCGRIPVFIDTDCVLPLDFDINWKKYCVYVKENEIAK